MKFSHHAFASLLFATLVAACSGSGDGSTGGETDTAETTKPVISEVGSPVGTAVTATVGADGATVVAGQVTLKVPAGAVSNAVIQLQPITNTLKGSGQGIQITSDTAWSGHLTLSLPIEAGDTDPAALGLAVQQPDGSWRALEPVKVDIAAGTVSAGLPADTDATTAAAPGRAHAQAAVVPAAIRVMKFVTAYLDPGSSVREVNATQGFKPWATLSQKRPTLCKYDIPTPRPGDDDLAPLVRICWRTVVEDYVFYNSLSGFERTWSVDGVAGGNGNAGTIKTTGIVGARYTAPALAPTPPWATVKFVSKLLADPACTAGASCRATSTVSASATVRIVSSPASWQLSKLDVPWQNTSGTGHGYELSATLPTPLLYECLISPGTPLSCQGSGRVHVVSRSLSQAGCRGSMDPASVEVDIVRNVDTGGATLRMADPSDPAQVPGNYEAIAWVGFDAVLVVEQDPADSAHECGSNVGRFPVSNFLWVLLTGGQPGVTLGSRSLEGRCVGPMPAGGAPEYECSGEGDFTFTWTLDRT